MKILILDNHTSSLDALCSLFPDDTVTVVPYTEPWDATLYDCIILSGGSQRSVFHQPAPRGKEIALIQTTNLHLIGICLGCELIAYAYGGRIQKLPRKITGTISIHYHHHNYTVREAHTYAIQSAGDNLLPLATSSTGIEIIKHRSKPIWGLQFHPEKQDSAPFTGRTIFEHIMKTL